MNEQDYEYRGMMAQSWDLLRGDTSGWQDRPFYRTLIERSGEPALDVGCGTGRLLLDYLRAGIDIDGVDNSPEMLALLREKAAAVGLSPALHLQEMQDLDLPRRYRTIIVPSSSFQLVLDPAEIPRPGDELIVLPRLDPKAFQIGSDLLGLIYQIAVATRIFL